MLDVCRHLQRAPADGLGLAYRLWRVRWAMAARALARVHASSSLRADAVSCPGAAAAATPGDATAERTDGEAAASASVSTEEITNVPWRAVAPMCALRADVLGRLVDEGCKEVRGVSPARAA